MDFTAGWASLNDPYLEGINPATPLCPQQPSSKGPLVVQSPSPRSSWPGMEDLGPDAWLSPEPHLPLISRVTLRPSGPLPPSHLADSTPEPQQGEEEKRSATLMVW